LRNPLSLNLSEQDEEYCNKMKYSVIKYFTILLCLQIFVASCNKRVNNDTTQPPQDRISIPEFGTQNTFEVACWNIEFFGNSPEHNAELQIIDVAEIIKDLNIDLFAVEEIASVAAFKALLDSLPNYDGVVATQTSPSFPLWTGIIYKKSIITISNEQILFTNDSYNFPRFPYSVYVRANQNNKAIDFTLIVLHLKAEDGNPSSQQRRKVAIQKLEQYVSDELQQGGDPDYIIAGDWNDKLEDDSTQNVFNPFLLKPQQYTFLTLPFAGSQTEYTYIPGSFKSLIDHIMVTASIEADYNIDTQIIKVDQFFSQYLAEVSDHRPVAARIPAF